MIVIDASALVAIALDEPERERFTARILKEDRVLISPVNQLEVGMVVAQRLADFDLADHQAWLDSLRIVRSDAASASSALEAFLAYGKGRHPARLNLGDCFAYALAKALNAPLLYKGNDFTQTDIRSAL